jgi:hypothetical protein
VQKAIELQKVSQSEALTHSSTTSLIATNSHSAQLSRPQLIEGESPKLKNKENLAGIAILASERSVGPVSTTENKDTMKNTARSRIVLFMCSFVSLSHLLLTYCCYYY